MNDIRACCPPMDLITALQLRKDRFDIGFTAGVGLRDTFKLCGMIEVPEW